MSVEIPQLGLQHPPQELTSPDVYKDARNYLPKVVFEFSQPILFNFNKASQNSKQIQEQKIFLSLEINQHRCEE